MSYPSDSICDILATTLQTLCWRINYSSATGILTILGTLHSLKHYLPIMPQYTTCPLYPDTLEICFPWHTTHPLLPGIQKVSYPIAHKLLSILHSPFPSQNRCPFSPSPNMSLSPATLYIPFPYNTTCPSPWHTTCPSPWHTTCPSPWHTTCPSPWHITCSSPATLHIPPTDTLHVPPPNTLQVLYSLTPYKSFIHWHATSYNDPHKYILI